MIGADPGHVVEAYHSLGRQLAARREAAGLAQRELAPLTLYGRSTIANVETGRQRVNREFWKRCDDALAAGGALISAYDEIEAIRRSAVSTALEPVVSATGDAAVAVPETRAGFSLLASPNTVSEMDPSLPVGTMSVWAPGGRFFPGLAVDAQVHPAVDDGRVLVQVPAGYGTDPFLHRPRRGLVVGAVTAGNGLRLYGMDTRHARRRLRGAATGAPLPVSRSYLLDEFTSAIVWAVANLDEALLDDDAVLTEVQRRAAAFEPLRASAGSADLASELGPVALRWLGSAFCAGHIQRHTGALHSVPWFWTTEERGEEASGWLLFDHKLRYLRVLADRFTDTTTAMVRAFCIPQAEVAVSPRAERILLVLTAALMESFGIEVAVTGDGEYRGLPGFVLDGGGQAIVANWVRAEGIWHVDLTDQRPVVGDYVEAFSHTRAHSIIAAATPPGRLRRLADYLELPWPWLRRRCTEVTEHGLAGLVAPRSRLLHLDGTERACRYISDLPDFGDG